jgi:hypothetical protein
MENEPSLLDVADEEFAQINKPEQNQEQGSILDIADNEFKQQEEESIKKEFDVSNLKQLKAEGKRLSDTQERMIFDEEDKVPLLESAGKAAYEFLPAAAQSFGQMATGGYELAKEAIVKPVVVGAGYQLGLATAKDTQEAYKGAKNAARSFVSGVASDIEDTSNLATRALMFGTSFTDKLQGMSADDRFKRYRLRDDMRNVEQAWREQTPDRAAALLSENPILQKMAGVAAKMQGGTEEEAKAAEKAYSELVLESGLTKDELNQNISAFGEFLSPISIPGGNIPTRAIGKYTGKALQKGGELALKGVVKPLAIGVEKTAGAIETGITGVQTGARKLGEYVSGDPDLLLRGGSIAGLIQAPAITGAILAAKPATIATKEIARTVKDIASQVDVGGAAGRRGLFERAGRAAESGALTKKLFSPEAMGGLGRAKAADWITRQSNAIVQQGVNGSVLNTMLGIPDIESAEQLGQVAGSGFGIGAFAGSRLVERAGAAIDPRTGLAQKIDTIITPDPSSRRADEDADIKRFLSSVDPDLVPKMEKLGSIDERKNAIQTKIDNLEKQKDTTFGPEVEAIKERISKQKKDLEALSKSTPETQKEVLRQVHLAFADEMDLAKTTGKAAGLNNIQVKILDPSEMEGFFRNSYGATLTDAENVIAGLTGKPDLSPQESENLVNARRIVDGFNNEVAGAQSARGLAISEGSDLDGNEVPAFMRKQNLQGATIVINGDLVKQLSDEGFNIRNVVGHEMQHALGKFTEVRDMLAPLRRELFDQKIVNEDGTVNKVTQGIYSDDKLDAYADTYAAAMSPSDNGESFKAQFPNQDKLRAYIKEEILSEIAGRSGNVSGGTRAGLDSIGRQVVDWIEVNTQNGALKKIKETLRKGGIIVDDSGDISTVLGAELTPESLAMIRQYQRQLKNLNQSMIYEEDARKEEVEIPITKILSDRTLQEKFKNSDIFEKEQVATMTAPDGSKQEIPIPPNAGVDPFVGTYQIQGGQLVDESGNPMNLGPNITFGTMPDGTQVEVGTRIARNVDGSPKILSNREIEARSRNRGKVIRNAIDSALSKGALQLEDTGNGNYRGVMSESQVNAVLALPNTIVSPNLKRQILFVNEILRRKDGTRMYMEYQAAMRGGKSRALAPQIRDEIPIGFQFSKQGNFLITTMSVSRMHDKMNAWLAKKPENLKLWNGDTASFWDDVIKVLDNHSKGERGETGLDPDAAIALEKKNAVNDLFNVWNADTKAANPRRTKLPVQKGKDPIDVIVRSRRIDRINQYNESSLKKMPFNYELNTKNYMPAENPLADFQTPEDFANELPSVTAEEIRNAINTGNLDQVESRLREGDDLKPAESLDEKDGNIRIVSMFDNEFMPQESLDFVDVKPTENDKRTNVGISFMPASEEDYAYRGQHKAPDQESGSPLNKVTQSIYPDDFYALPFEKTLQYYGSGEPRSDSESLSAILSAKDKPNAKVKVYRAVPKYTVQIDPVKAKEIEDRISKFEKLARLNPWSEDFKKQLDDALAERPQVISDINAGDWVTPSRSYAVDHGEGALNGQYRILSKSVPASHLFTEGNSLSEFGYNPPSTKGLQFMPADSEYLNLAKDPEKNREQLQRMVDDAAKGAGYSVGKVFHGTKKEFNEFQSQRDPYQLIYFSYDKKFAQNYARGYGGHRDPSPKVRERIDKVIEESEKKWRPVSDELTKKYPEDSQESLEAWTKYFEDVKTWQKSKLDGMTVGQAEMEMGINVIPAYLKAEKIFDPASQWEEFLPEILKYLQVKSVGELKPELIKMIKDRNYLIWEDPQFVAPAVFNKYQAMLLNESGATNIAIRDPKLIKKSDSVTYDDNGNAVPLSQRFNPKTSDIRFMPAEQPTKYEPISARIRPLEGISAPTKQVGAKGLSLGEIEPPVRGKAMLPDMELKPDISEKSIQSSDITTSAKPAPDAVIKPFSNALVSSAGLINFLPAFHGTPFDVDKFKLEKIGTGEGAQAYGWGLYFAQARKVAQDYKDKLTDWNSPGTYEWKGMSLRSDDYKNPIRHAISLVYHQGINQAKQIGKTLQKDSEKGEPYTVEQGGLEYAKKFNDALSQVKSKKEITFEQGNLYKVDLDVKDEDLLDWDKPLSEQSEKVQEAFNLKKWSDDKIQITDLDGIDNILSEKATLGDAYKLMGEAKDVSLYLLSSGIPGIRYLDGTSRKQGDGTYNYVVFDENLIKILDKNDKPVQDELPRATGLQFMPAEGAKKPKTAKKEPKKKKEAEKQYITIDSGDDETVPVLQEIRNGKPLTDPKGDPKFVQQKYDLLASPFVDNYSGNDPEDTTKPNYDELAYDVSGVAQKKINAAIDSGAVDAAANIMVSKTNEAMKNADISAGSGWYSRMRENLLNALGVEGRELLSQLLGATSAKTPVNENFLQAMDGYEGMKSGRYDSNRKAYLEMINAESKNELNDLIDDRNYIAVIKNKISDLNKAAKKLTGKKQKVIQSEVKKLKDLIAIKPEDRTKKNRFSIVINASGLMPLRSNGKKFNANSMAVMKVIAGTWLDNRKAPKTPNFAGNLSGRTVQATIDVWAARFMRQILHEGFGTPWRIQPKSETGVTNEDFALGQVVMQRAAKKLGMNPDDLQAILWFAEKHNWDDRGWTGAEGAEKSSFDEIFSVFFPKSKKPLTFSEASEVLKSQKNKDESIDESIDEQIDEDTDEE